MRLLFFVFLFSVAVSAEACIPKPPEEKLKELDTNGDGSISLEEYKTDRQKKYQEEIKLLEKESGGAAPAIQEIGADPAKRRKQIDELFGDKKSSEFFNQQDLNKDGKIDLEEIKKNQEDSRNKSLGCG